LKAKIQHIAILTTSHPALDDRFFYHFASTLRDEGCQTAIFVTTKTEDRIVDGILVRGIENTLAKAKKITWFVEQLLESNPNTVICVDPLTVLAAKKYKKQSKKNVLIVYDITEWYPSKKNIEELKGFKKLVKVFTLFFFGLYAVAKADKLIEGEYYKGRFYRFFLFWKPIKRISYYPSQSYIKYTPIEANKNKVTLAYTGRISIEKGTGVFLKVAESIAQNNPNTKIKAVLLGRVDSEKDRENIQRLMPKIHNLEITWSEEVPYQEYIKRLADFDVLFDLRVADFENQHCLPIKLFYYMAVGRPFIYTKLKAITQALGEEVGGFLVDPNDTLSIIKATQQYIDSPIKMQEDANRGRALYLRKYNWEKIKIEFLDWVLK